MALKKQSIYTAEIDGHAFPVPFAYEDGTEVLKIEGTTARLGVCVWSYTREGGERVLIEEDRHEVWGYIGFEYAEQTLKDEV